MIDAVLRFDWLSERGLVIVLMPLPIGSRLEEEPEELEAVRSLTSKDVRARTPGDA